MRDVELVETDDATAPAPARAPSFLDRVRRRPRWLAAGAAVVVALVGYQVVSDRRLQAQDDARAAALADVPMVLDPVDPTFPVLVRGAYTWQDDGVPPVASAYLGSGVLVDDVVVTATTGGPQARVVGLDPATAQVVWDTTIVPSVQPFTDAGGWCWEPTDPDATTARCHVRWQRTSVDGNDWEEFGALVEVDASDGSVVRRTDLPVGAVLAVGEQGPVVGVLDASRLTLDASAWDGTHLWTRTLDVPGPDDETYVNLLLVEDHLLVTDGGGESAWVLSASEGAVLRTLDGGTRWWGIARLLTDGTVVATDPALAGDEPTGDAPAMLVRPDGSRVSFDGDHVEWVVLDDGTLGDALLTGTAAVPGYTRTRGGTPVPGDTADGSVARLREPDGTVRWEVPGLDVLAAIAVDGLVVARTTDEVVAVDARSGRVRWRASMPTDGRSSGALLTDGRVILVPRPGGQLDALSYRGEPRWSVHVESAGDEHVVVPGPAPTPEPAEGDAADRDEVQWVASPSGRLVLGVMDLDGEGQEYLVFGH